MSIEIPESSEQGGESAGLDDAQHERIVFSLWEIDSTRESEDEDLYYAFDASKYRDLQTVYGYERATVTVEEDGPVSLCLVHPVSNDRQQVETYVYDFEGHSLRREVILRHDNEITEQLGYEYEKLKRAAGIFEKSAREIYALMWGQLEEVEEYATLLREYRRVKEEVSRRRIAIFTRPGSDDSYHTILAKDEENEAILARLIERVASKDEYFAQRVRRRKEDLDAVQKIHEQMKDVASQIDDEEDEQTEYTPADPSEFIRLLDVVTQLGRADAS